MRYYSGRVRSKGSRLARILQDPGCEYCCYTINFCEGTPSGGELFIFFWAFENVSPSYIATMWHCLKDGLPCTGRSEMLSRGWLEFKSNVCLLRVQTVNHGMMFVYAMQTHFFGLKRGSTRNKTMHHPSYCTGEWIAELVSKYRWTIERRGYAYEPLGTRVV